MSMKGMGAQATAKAVEAVKMIAKAVVAVSSNGAGDGAAVEVLNALEQTFSMEGANFARSTATSGRNAPELGTRTSKASLPSLSP
jgi:hypothetical protein